MEKQFGYKIMRKSMHGREIVDNKIAGAYGFFSLEEAINSAKKAVDNIIKNDYVAGMFSLICFPYSYKPVDGTYQEYIITSEKPVVIHIGQVDDNPDEIPDVFRQKSIFSEVSIQISSQYFL